MRKFLVFPIVAGLVVAAAGVSQAQTGQGCGGTVQSYQRYSYQPVPAPVVVQGNAVNAPVVSSPAPMVTSPQVVSQFPQVSSPQVYRRYSYVPQSYYGSTSGHKKNLWEYAKGDPRRYRP